MTEIAETVVAPGAGVPAKAMPRRQVDGVAEVAVDTVFARPSERFLACFAQPGETNSFAALTADVEDDFFDALDSPVLVRASDARAAAELKRIVAGLKEEARMLVHAGWTVRDIAERFKERARMEADYRARAIGAVRAAWREDPLAAERKMAEHNGWLRAMGIAEISADELRALRPTD